MLMSLKPFKPRYILAVYLGLCFVFGLAATLTHRHASVALLILVVCFESVCSQRLSSRRLLNTCVNRIQACFATIFTLALRGLGRHTKRGGSLLVAAISGGAAVPPMAGAVATRTGSFHTAMAIPTAFFVLGWVFPVYANVWNSAVLDGHRDTDLNVSAVNALHVDGKERNMHARPATEVEKV